jgi:hypothetical protein
MAQNGLRTPGGSGHGSADMTGRDVALLTIALAMNIPTKDAASVMSSIDAMTRQGGIWWEGDEVRWQGNGPLKKGHIFELMERTNKIPSGKLPSAYTFGEFLGAWVDGILDPQLGTFQDGETELVLHREGPWARFRFKGPHDEVELTYAADGYVPPIKPAWEHPLIIRGEMFQRMAKIIA